FTLVSFGGAGGLHAAALAEALHIPRLLIPAYPGAFSALGVLLADVIKDYSQTLMLTIETKSAAKETAHTLARHFARMEKDARRDLRGEGFSAAQIRLERLLALRYRGQSFELEIAFDGSLDAAIQQFHQTHHDRYGHSNPAAAIELVSARLRGIGITQKPELKPQRKQRRTPQPVTEAVVRLERNAPRVPVYERASLPIGCVLTAPALIVEYGSTTLLPVGWQAEVDAWSNLVLQRQAA
ncbi:MAG TPA: hydantoinase/oxoprolinase family protein, partial [Blastocatellia bacterium]|nr:hydantoinase/oxoprolinase family protein [Blastocatellia bacterium]